MHDQLSPPLVDAEAWVADSAADGLDQSSGARVDLIVFEVGGRWRFYGHFFFFALG